MSIERGPNPLKHGGVVYLSDGEGSSAACIRTDKDDTFDPLKVCRGKPDGIQHRPQGGPGYSSFVGLSGCIGMEKSRLVTGYYSLYQPQGYVRTHSKLMELTSWTNSSIIHRRSKYIQQLSCHLKDKTHSSLYSWQQIRKEIHNKVATIYFPTSLANRFQGNQNLL